MRDFGIILHPTDFSIESDRAFKVACSIARDQYAKLIVLHVLSPSACPEVDSDAELLNGDRPAVSHCREEFQRMQAMQSGVPLTFRITVGYAVGMILNVARQENADLIVIASHRSNQFHFQIHDSVADGVLRQAWCPVLCLRQSVSVAAKSPTGSCDKQMAPG